MGQFDPFSSTPFAQQPGLQAPVFGSKSLLDPNTSGTPSTFSGKAVSPEPVDGDPTRFSKRMTDAGNEADQKLGDTQADGACSTCPFKVRLEHKSRYTKKYLDKEWVPWDAPFTFLIGQERVLSVRVAEPAGASATWKIEPVGDHSGVVKPATGTGNQFDYTPNADKRKPLASGSRSPNKPVEYKITATVTHNGGTQEVVETIKQDEKDIIRQEYVDFRTWFVGKKGDRFVLHVPLRNHVVAPSRPSLRTGNYSLVVDSATSELLAAVEANLGGKVTVNSGWRNPRRNQAVGGVTNSNHQHGGAVDMKPTVDGAGKPGGMYQIYNAALKSGGRAAILEHGGTAIYPTNKAVPAISDESPDKNNNGVPDTMDGKFAHATHVHIDRDPPNGGEDD
ncbi:D-Ala-D-Ala carboxypeptidase family metallohydrolase [Chondromyces crocatus]|uniref:Peptidase M15A C-terminal domain-containing protein n=1 Tax=Chondromyces crocatus TaxID=52 RepID=A0A0K1EM94_CHOCO|nr:D-Ala-D-Ala carboxypeptidase family metallohydrolase [Chondromyces crocatus]AKT41738.1 uncharacterized protein CMC5_059490 [Chondromyces crocatus]